MKRGKCRITERPDARRPGGARQYEQRQVGEEGELIVRVVVVDRIGDLEVQHVLEVLIRFRDQLRVGRSPRRLGGSARRATDVQSRRDEGEDLERLKPALVRPRTPAIDVGRAPAAPSRRLARHVDEIVLMHAQATHDVNQQLGGAGALGRRGGELGDREQRKDVPHHLVG